jgi:hypothetical protein
MKRLCAALVVVCGCGGEPAASPSAPVLLERGADAAEAADDQAPETEASMPEAAEAAADAPVDVAQEGSASIACDPGQACNALLTADGKCPGTCIDQVHGVTCKGTVSHALCHAVPPEKPSNIPITVQGVTITPGPMPAKILAGDTFPISITLVNTNASAVSLPFSYFLLPTWQISNANFEGLKSIGLDAGQSFPLQADITATDSNVFQGSYLMLAATFDSVSFTLSALAEFGSGAGIACGGFDFPASYSPCSSCSAYQQYGTARCCDDVFYPAADCCGDADCAAGACFDGRCVSDAPSFLQANTLAQGPQRVLLVIGDLPEYESYAPCVDHAASLGPLLKLEEVEKFFQQVSLARTQDSSLSLNWTVLAGMHVADLASGEPTFANVYAGLGAWLSSHGCPMDLAVFDKTLVGSPLLQLNGFAGQAYDKGRIGVAQVSDPMLLAHELAHTLGADDLYTTMGGYFQYVWELMGNNFGQHGAPGDAVLWGQCGMGDTNRNGVIDRFEYAIAPESLTVVDCHAKLTQKSTLEVTTHVGAIEGGLARKALMLPIKVALVETPAEKELAYGDTLVFDGSEVDLAALAQKSAVKVRVTGAFAYTDAAFKRVHLDLDSTLDVALEKP